jgi:hypothetical protein
LKPEKTVTADIGLLCSLILKKINLKTRISIPECMMLLQHSISIWGQSVILYDGTLKRFANQNKEKLLLQDCQ